MKIPKPKIRSKRSKKAGLPPGTLVYVGEKAHEPVKIKLIDYSEENFQEKQLKDIKESFPFKTSPTVTWINIDGIQNVELLEQLGIHFDLHPLVLEDILNTTQRPKFEDFEKYIYIVLKMLTYDDQQEKIHSEQVSLILGNGCVISFQEAVGDVFENIRDRIRNAKGRIRKMSAGYLVYALMDAVVDNYFIVLEKFGEKIEGMEEKLITDPDEQMLLSIHAMKRELITMRKSVWPLRELVSNLQRSESELISDSIEIFFRDVYDHTIQIIDTLESYRDMVSGMLDIYLSILSNKMNVVMKVLTIIATIFIPLTFIAGIYGMNFEFMPELKIRWAYPAVWFVMLIVAMIMVLYFKSKKWF